VLYGRVAADRHHPGFDRELVDGQIKRVFEANYLKVLVTEREFLTPELNGMTPTTAALLRHLFQCRLRLRNTPKET